MKKFFLALLMIQAAGFVFSSCKKNISTDKEQLQVSSLMKAAPHDKNEKKIQVSTVNELYDVVNDPVNAASQIELAPGTYALNSNHPNAGRIEFLYDMEIHGQSGHPESVVIDGSGLPASSFLLTPNPAFPGVKRTGVIRMGNGSNTIEWVTIKGYPSTDAYSVIETDLNKTPLTNIRVAHCIVTGGQIGINIRNRDQEANGRIIEAKIEHNELSENLAGFGQGIGIFNARDVTGGIIRASLEGNYVHDNRMGLRAWNVVSNQCVIAVQSINDRFEDNGLGVALLGAFNEYPNFTANNNFTGFVAHGTTILNNQGVPALPTGTAQVLPGGIMATGSQVSVNSLPGTASGNRLEIELWGCRFDGNLPPNDINAFGARSTFPSPLPAGTNNVVNIQLHGVSQNAIVGVTASFPVEPAGTNVVNVIR